MVRNREITDQFLLAYTENELGSVQNILYDKIKLNYSNIGMITGRENVLKSLAWQQNFDVRRVTVTNEMSYVSDNIQTTGLIAHHLVSHEKNNEFFPFVFGGKYVFSQNITTQQIEQISFVLEYQAENTIYAKGLWKLSNGRNDYSSLSSFDTGKILDSAEKEQDFRSLVNLFFWCLDTEDIPLLQQIVSDDFIITREQSVGEGRFEGRKALQNYIALTNSYYALDEHSIRINETTERGNGEIYVYAQHLTPHRLGTKKLNSITKYHSFFDEDIYILIDRNTFRLRSVTMKKAADVSPNGIRLLRY